MFKGVFLPLENRAGFKLEINSQPKEITQSQTNYKLICDFIMHTINKVVNCDLTKVTILPHNFTLLK